MVAARIGSWDLESMPGEQSCMDGRAARWTGGREEGGYAERSSPEFDVNVAAVGGDDDLARGRRLNHVHRRHG